MSHRRSHYLQGSLLRCWMTLGCRLVVVCGDRGFLPCGEMSRDEVGGHGEELSVRGLPLQVADEEVESVGAGSMLGGSGEEAECGGGAVKRRVEMGQDETAKLGTAGLTPELDGSGAAV